MGVDDLSSGAPVALRRRLSRGIALACPSQAQQPGSGEAHAWPATGSGREQPFLPHPAFRKTKRIIVLVFASPIVLPVLVLCTHTAGEPHDTVTGLAFALDGTRLAAS